MHFEHQEGIKALKLCLNLHKYENFTSIGLTQKDFELIKEGRLFFTEEQLYRFIDILRENSITNIPLNHWLGFANHWALSGILEPTFSFNGIPIRAILDYPYVFINNPDLHIHVGDTLIHSYSNKFKEELFVVDMRYSPYTKGFEPIYILTVTRSKSTMQNTNNFNFGDNTHISGNAHFNAGNVIDSSHNMNHELPENFFPQLRKLLESIDEKRQQELFAILSKIEDANCNNERIHWFGNFISKAADYVALLQPAITILGRFLFS